MTRALLAAAALAACGSEAVSMSGNRRLKGVSRGPSPEEIVEGRVIAAFESAFEAPKGKAPNAGGGADAASRPVQVQIDEKVIAETESHLSAPCKARFGAMMEGKGPRMAAFKEHGDADGEKSCGKLDGNICHTSAEIAESQVHTDGRKLGQAMKVAGNSCMPSQCIQADDLATLAVFLRSQAKEVMPGDQPTVTLRVDCSRSGGSDVYVDGTGALHKSVPALAPRSGAAAPSLAVAALAGLAAIALAA